MAVEEGLHPHMRVLAGSRRPNKAIQAVVAVVAVRGWCPLQASAKTSRAATSLCPDVGVALEAAPAVALAVDLAVESLIAPWFSPQGPLLRSLNS